MTFVNIQQLYHRLAVMVLLDLTRQENAVQQIFLKKALQLHSGCDLDKNYIAHRLKRCLYKELKRSSPRLKSLVENASLKQDVEKRGFFHGLANVLGSELKLCDRLSGKEVICFKPSDRDQQVVKDAPYQLDVDVLLDEEACFKSDALSSSSSGSSDEKSCSESDEHEAPVMKRKKEFDEYVPTTKKRKVVMFENNDDGVDLKQLKEWSVEDRGLVFALQKRREVIRNVLEFIDKLENSLGSNTLECGMCKKHCFQVLGKDIKRTPGRPILKKK